MSDTTDPVEAILAVPCDECNMAAGDPCDQWNPDGSLLAFCASRIRAALGERDLGTAQSTTSDPGER